jgi:putative FmdB family regulatory protein
MPMYEYECTACGHRFELIRKFSDPPIDECPNCGESNVQKLVSSPAIQFKGTGWYITDYARKGATGTDTNTPALTDGSKDGDTKSSSESKESKESNESKSKESKSKESKSTAPAAATTSTAKASGE